MVLTKTFVVAAAIAGGLLSSPPAAAAPRRIPEPPPWPVPRVQLSERTVIHHPALRKLAAHEQPSQKGGTSRTRGKR